jgi:5-methylcytosine-specific restriction endonuclease McrA
MLNGPENRFPRKLRKAVFLRDKGRSQSCFVDLPGTMALDPKVHFDHIVSLGQLWFERRD